jgi:hypothetical protein
VLAMAQAGIVTRVAMATTAVLTIQTTRTIVAI